MISDIRRQYNDKYSDDKYEAFCSWIAEQHNHRPPFKIAETPVFIDRALKQQLFEACTEISQVFTRPDFKAITQGALLQGYEVPNETPNTLFLQLDFGICSDGNGGLIPQLIEAQGFPSLYYYQHLVAEGYRKFFDIPEHLNHLFNGFTSDSYHTLLKEIILGDHSPKHVVLLEIDPNQQATAVDFYATQAALGIPIVGIEDVKRTGRSLFYKNQDGEFIEIRRIYNRVIFDELVKVKDWKDFDFTMLEDVDVEWAGHPNWFFRISKYALPFLESKYVPKSYFLSELESIPEDLKNYVLKPLFSFSGSGVIVDLKKEDLANIKDRGNYLLQQKVEYASIIQTLDMPAKCELRMLMIWKPGDESPQIVNNLARLSKGQMIGVRYNKGRTWVGGSVGFFEE